MQKMMAAYQHLSSYTGSASADLTLSSGKQLLRSQSISSQMQMQRPNKIVVIIYNSSASGTRSIYSDGANLTVYDAIPKRYTVTPTAPDMTKLLQLMAAQAHVSAQLDPLYFMCVNKLPAGLTALKAAGSAIVNGRDSLIVTGLVPADPAPATGNKKKALTSSMHWTWYIDKQTSLLNKVEAQSDPFMMPVRLRQKGKLVTTTLPAVMKLRHNVSTFAANPAIDANAFVFTAPAGAVQQKSVSEMLKGAH